MGAKAKQAISGAERAIASMTGVVRQLKTHFDAMYAQQGQSIDLKLAMAKHFQTTYPGEDNLRARVGQDNKLLKFMGDIAESKAKASNFQRDCLLDLQNFEEEGEKIIAALNKVTELIQAKRAKRNEPTKNVIKKLVNKVKTKSLGDLVAERAKVIAVINELGPIIDHIKADINFRDKA